MKKRILAVMILALMVVSVFALSSCGKGKTVPCPNCEGNLIADEKEGIYECDLGQTHSFDICVNENCREPIDNSPPNKKGDPKYCSACGTSQESCYACDDPSDIEGAYCYACGKQVVRDGQMQFKFDVKALGDSAMILCKGMLGIFIVTGIIIAFILALNTIVEKIRQSKENK